MTKFLCDPDALGIPVMGHIGLTPQSINALGGYKVQGTTVEGVQSLLEDALELQDAGTITIDFLCKETVNNALCRLLRSRPRERPSENCRARYEQAEYSHHWHWRWY